MLKLQNVRKVYHSKAGDVNALDGLSVTFPKSGMVFITGKSGCGKTTLLNVIGGLDGIDGGEILIQDKRFSAFTPAEYDSYRNTYIGFIFQEYNLLPDFTVANNIKMAMELQGQITDEEELNRLLKEVGISDLKDRYPSELSGGQRQRVAIARALVKHPHIIMADEPTGALDSAIGIQVLDTLKKLSKDKLVIVVSHDMDFAEKYADRIIHLVDGKIDSDITFANKSIDGNVGEREDAVVVKEGSDLSEDEKNVLAKAVKDKKKIELVGDITYRDKVPTGKVKHDAQNPVALTSSKMKIKSSAFLGLKSLIAKPVRLIITVIISALAFAVFGLFDTIANFSTEKVLHNFIKTSPSPTIVVDANYIVDEEGEDKYPVKLDDATIGAFAKKTQGVVKGIYGFKGDSNVSVAQSKPISQLTQGGVFVGSRYYTSDVTGFVEFDADSDIDANGNFKDFGFKMLYGRYPKLLYRQDIENEEYETGEARPGISENITYSDELAVETLMEVAISSYLAESIMHYLPNSNLDGVAILQISDLIGKTITVDSANYTIVGIIDCGAIPKKFMPLKTGSVGDLNLDTLSTDFTSYVNAGLYNCLFVGKKFVREWEKLLNLDNYTYIGHTYWDFTIGEDSAKRKIADYVVPSHGYDADNMLLFSGQYPNGRLTLADDEVMVHHNNLRYLYDDHFYNIGYDDRQAVTAAIEGMAKQGKADNRETLKNLLAKLNVKNEPIPITINATSTKTGAIVKKELKIVGVYFGVDKSQGLSSTFKFMMNDKLMADFGICANQGGYNRMIFSEKSVVSGGDYIVKNVTSTKGLTLNLHKNSALTTIKDNETSIRQIADLFLYVAIALALFSVFMLYNYISTSIANKRQSVGVLRALGAGSKDIFIVFIIESLAIGIVNAILANLLALLGCAIVNAYIVETMFISIHFAIFGWRQILFISGIGLATALIASALPIVRISKKKPVDLIRRS